MTPSRPIVCFTAALAIAFSPGLAAALPDLLRGAIDLHCHSGPDIVPRSVTDIELARQGQAAGLRAVVIKNHHTPTAARAQLASVAVPGIEVFGGIALNHAVGGLNATAVRRMTEMEGNRGKFVWLPTFDAENAVRAANESRPFVSVVAQGQPVPALAEIFAVAARHQLVLATGHSSAAEILVLIAAAKAAGVQHIVVTHALFPSSRATDVELRAMASLGAWIELAWLMHHTPKPAPGLPAVLARPMVPLARAVDVIRDLGARHIVISSDFGQASNPPPTEGLRAFLTALLAAGIPPADLDLMVRRNPAAILGLEP
jgi:hypothetical protein